MTRPGIVAGPRNSHADRKLTILTYHSIDQSGSPISVDRGSFESHVRWLANHGIDGVTLCEGLRRVLSDGPSKPCVALTFDDGFLNTATVALPILAAHDFKATVFLVADYLGRTNDFPGQPTHIPRSQLLDRGAAQSLIAAGWEIGAHTRTHTNLTCLDQADLIRETAGSKGVLEQTLGTAIEVFAYPYGFFRRREMETVAESFRFAVTTELRVARAGTNPYALPRLDAYYLTRPSLFPFIDAPWMEPYLAIRRVARSVRGLAR